MSAQAEALVASWELLPAEALERVLTHVSGDVLALCAAACVSRAWRDVAARVQPLSAVRLPRLPYAVAPRLTDLGLAALVRRAHGRLEYLDVGGAGLLTDEGIIAALQQPHALTTFIADDAGSITAQGVTRALAPQRGRLLDLQVAGLDCLPHKPGGEITVTAWHQERINVVNVLRTLMAPRGRLIGTQMCWHGNNDSDPKDEPPCACMCGPDDACQECGVVLCGHHEDGRFSECYYCSRCFCTDDCLPRTGLCAQCADKAPDGAYDDEYPSD
jgi:hypothetical protein